jgi:outer membrane immunogenic protein
MRLLVRGLLLAGIASPAFAADIDNSWLRGSSSFPADPPTYRRWSGFYGGGQVGADFRGVDFRNSPNSPIANIVGQDAILQMLPVAQMPSLPSIVKMAPSYGGFLGYNYQIDDVVLGIEANFNWADMTATASDSLTRNFVVTFGGHTYAPLTLTVTGSENIVLNDYGSVRARAAWAYGSFLPYAFFGISVAQVSTTRAVNVAYAGTDVTPQTSPGNPGIIPVGAHYTQADNIHGKYVFGFASGLGVDYALTQRLFLRGEIEYLQLNPPNDIKLNTTSVRAGAGLKF